jgi:predicted ATP-dependent serine protease
MSILETFTTGIECLDSMLGGGFLKHAINMIYGEPGSAKTSLILHTIAHNINNNDNNQLFCVIDTEQGWSDERIKQVLSSHGINDTSKIKLFHVSSFREQNKVITKDWEKLIQNRKPSLFVVDSFINFYHQQLLNTPIALMAGLARQLQGKLATEIISLYKYSIICNCPTILVSWSSSSVGSVFEEIEMGHSFEEYEKTGKSEIEELLPLEKPDVIGGKRLRYMSKIILKLLTGKKSDVRFAILKKHVCMPTDRITYFKVSNNGIDDVKSPVYTVSEFKQILYEKWKKSKEKEEEKEE